MRREGRWSEDHRVRDHKEETCKKKKKGRKGEREDAANSYFIISLHMSSLSYSAVSIQAKMLTASLLDPKEKV